MVLVGTTFLKNHDARNSEGMVFFAGRGAGEKPALDGAVGRA